MLENEKLSQDLTIALNRKTKRSLRSYLRQNKYKSAEIIIDATVIKRFGRSVENAKRYHSGSGLVWGHKVINIGLLLDDQFYIPLDTIPHYTEEYAAARKKRYQTEPDLVITWVREHIDGLSKCFGEYGIQKEDITFLLDAGYDCKKLQRCIIEVGCHFTMMIKKTTCIEKLQVKNYFHRHRNLNWKNIHLDKTAQEKTQRRKYRIREAQNVLLSKVGIVQAICSEKQARRGSTTRRYLISSRPSDSGRDILKRYANRWKIETWHKTMKQAYGFGDCRAKKFVSLENHLKICNLAYLYKLEGHSRLPADGIGIAQVVAMQATVHARATATQAEGMESLEKLISSMKKEVYENAA